jgi:hypothetical protein
MAGANYTEAARFPRPQISDLLILMLCVSVVFGFNAPSYQDAFKLYVIKWHDLLPNLLDEFATSLCMFGFLVLLRQSVRRAKYPLAPGHVAIWTLGPFQVFGLILNVFRPFYGTGDHSVWDAVDYGACALVFAASLIYPLLTIHHFKWWWRVCLYLLVLSLAIYALECALDAATELDLIGIFHRRHLLATIGNLDVLILLVACGALAMDVHNKDRHDWLHYVGVLLLLMHLVAAAMHWWRLMQLWWQALYNHLVP